MNNNCKRFDLMRVFFCTLRNGNNVYRWLDITTMQWQPRISIFALSIKFDNQMGRLDTIYGK